MQVADHSARVDDMDKSDRAKLLQLMQERPAVEDWPRA
jgi:hypothetical protein